MPRVRIQVPIEVEVSPELEDAGAAVVGLAKALVDSDALRQAARVATTARRAWNKHGPRR